MVSVTVSAPVDVSMQHVPTIFLSVCIDVFFLLMQTKEHYIHTDKRAFGHSIFRRIFRRCLRHCVDV